MQEIGIGCAILAFSKQAGKKETQKDKAFHLPKVKQPVAEVNTSKVVYFSTNEVENPTSVCIKETHSGCYVFLSQLQSILFPAFFPLTILLV